jgi:hypothetical protein
MVAPTAVVMLASVAPMGAYAGAAEAPGAPSPYPIDLAQAQEVFAEAQRVSAKEGGRLWGKPLYGPMFLVDPATRAVVANEADGQGVLRPQGSVYLGTLPESVIVANSPAEWGGKRWTMLLAPTLPQDPLTRHIMLAHELFHRIQPELHLMSEDSLCGHLDTPEGRIWLQLEWRALAAALVSSGPAQAAAIRDALAFRAHRHELFLGSATKEASQEVAEGIPEYTGAIAGAPDRDAARWRAIARLSDPDLSLSFVRAFAYLSGPAYGLLLDQHLPAWRAQAAAQTDLGALLASSLQGAMTASASSRAPLYGESAIRLSEADRAARADAEKARYRALLVEGPTLTLQSAGHLHFSFNPSTLVSLGEAGTVYPTFHAADAWGTLDVKEGVLLSAGFKSATVAAPADITGPHLQGRGWTLDLAPGWHVIPASTPGSFTLRQE